MTQDLRGAPQQKKVMKRRPATRRETAEESEVIREERSKEREEIAGVEAEDKKVATGSVVELSEGQASS